jgi:hypothetical protein
MFIITTFSQILRSVNLLKFITIVINILLKLTFFNFKLIFFHFGLTFFRALLKKDKYLNNVYYCNDNNFYPFFITFLRSILWSVNSHKYFTIVITTTKKIENFFYKS